MIRPPSRLASLVLLACLAALGGGCATLKIKQPTATFRGISVENVTPDGIDLAFEFNLRNPNDFHLPITAAHYRLALDGQRVLAAGTNPSEALPPYGSMPVTLRARPTFQQLFPVGPSISAEGEIDYAFEGALDMVPSRSNDLPAPWPGRRVRLLLDAAGKVAMRDAIDKALHDPTVLRSPDAWQFLKTVVGEAPLIEATKPRVAMSATRPATQAGAR